MKRLTLFTLFGLFVQLSDGSAYLDSLFGSLNNVRDSQACKTYQRIAFALMETDPDSGRYYGQQALELAIELNRQPSQITSINAIGLSYFYESDFPNAIHHWRGALQKGKEFGIDKYAFSLLIRLGAAYSNLALYDSARFYIQEARVWASARQDSAAIISTFLNEAVCDVQQGLNDDAIRKNLRVFNWYRRQGEAQHAAILSKVATNLGSSYINFSDWENAMEFARLSIRLAQKANANFELVNGYTLVGVVYLETKAYDSSLVYFKKSLQLLGPESSPSVKAKLYNNMGLNNMFLGALDSATSYYKKALEIGEQIEAPYSQCLALMGFAQVAVKRKQTNKALQYGLKAYTIAKQKGFNTELNRTAKLLGNLYSISGNADSALVYILEHIALKDSFTSIETLQRINALKHQHDLNIEQARYNDMSLLNELNAEKLYLTERKNRSLVIFSVLSLLLLLGTIILLVINGKNKKNLQLLNSRLEREKLKLETEQQRLDIANHTLRETQAQLIQNEKLAGIGQLTAGIAHEINNPINYVKAGIDSLKMEIQDIKQMLGKGGQSTPQSESATSESHDIESIVKEIDLITQSITSGANKAAEIVRGLRIYSRTSSGQLTNVDVNQSVENSLLLLRSEYKDRITIEKDLAQNAVIEGYGEKLDQVVMNLLSNAIQAIEGSGSIGIHTSRSETHLMVEISDTGTGIPKEMQDKIFDPFYTTKEIGKGTGLGLSITLGIIKDHSGTIEVSSEPGATVFTIKLPWQQPK